jgi:hypothetical protein
MEHTSRWLHLHLMKSPTSKCCSMQWKRMCSIKVDDEPMVMVEADVEKEDESAAV